MKIDIYSDFEVKMTTKGCTKVGFDEFENFEFEKEETLNGGELLSSLGITFMSDLTSNVLIDVENKTIKIELFNPTSGESEDVTYEIKKIK